ncbi:MAG: ABC transporter substrate-binding protein [bacterium]|nr:ABC transporter substrate-binding protein [bacterium]
MKLQGYDKKNGFDLEYKPISLEARYVSLFNKTVDVVVLDPLQVADLNLEGKKIKIFTSAPTTYCNFLVRSDSPIKTIEELKGKKLGVTSKIGSSSYANLALLLKKKGENIENYYQIISGSLEALPTFLSRGDVDALVNPCGEVQVGKLLASGKVKTIGSIGELLKKTYGNTDRQTVMFAAREEWLTSHQKEAKEYTRAVEETMKYIKDNPQKVYANEQIKKDFELTTEEIKQIIELRKNGDPYSSKDWEKVTKEVDFYIKDAADAGFIKGVPKEKIYIKF